MNRKEFEATLTLLGFQEYVIDKHEITWSNPEMVIHIMSNNEISCWHTGIGLMAINFNCELGYQQIIDFLTGAEDDPG